MRVTHTEEPSAITLILGEGNREKVAGLSMENTLSTLLAAGQVLLVSSSSTYRKRDTASLTHGKPFIKLFFCLRLVLYMCLYMGCGCKCSAHKGQKRATDHTELELQAVVNRSTRVLETQTGPSEEQQMLLATEPSLQPSGWAF